MAECIQRQYKLLVSELYDSGNSRDDRTGVGTNSLFFRTLSHDLQRGFPLITYKRVFWKGVFEELMWMLRGETNIKSLNDHGVHIWDEWANDDGDLGYIYGAQWRNWGLSNGRIIDQIDNVICQIKKNPNSRRHVVSAWNVNDLPEENLSAQDNVECELMALAPCHYAFQFYVSRGTLSCLMHMRSSDVFLGLPFNIAQYALLTHIIAKECDLIPSMLHITLGDVHLYKNHRDQALEMLSRSTRPLPFLNIPVKKKFDEYEYHDFILNGYDPYPAIKAQVAV
jgi:thymidylate synthase